MKIFIQGRKNGNKPLYPKPTPNEFYKWAGDIQRLDAPNNAQCYGKSLYSIAFNGSGCILTKYIIGYDTLREYIGNIGISIFIASNQKMSGVDIKTLLDELINIYTTNYCPDFKINDQKQENWPMFQSAADSYDVKVKSISSEEHYEYGSKDAAYVFYNDITEIEKYLDAPYQEEFKGREQVFFIENQSKLILDVIKHDQTANLTGKIDFENPPLKLSDYNGQGNGFTIEILSNGKLRNKGDKIFKNDNVRIKYSKKYHEDILEEGKLIDPNIENYLTINGNKIEVEKNPNFIPTKKYVDIIIKNSKGESITDAEISYKKNSPNAEKKACQNTIAFLGEEQKDHYTIFAKKGGLSGEIKITPDKVSSIVELTLKEDKLEKQGNETSSNSTSSDKSKFDKITSNKKIQLAFVILGGLCFFCSVVYGAFKLYDFFYNNNRTDVSFQTSPESKSDYDDISQKKEEIKKYVEGDSLLLDKLKDYSKELKNVKIPSPDNTIKEECEKYIEKAIKKRNAINQGNFAFLNNNDSVNYSNAQLSFKSEVNKINNNQYEQVKTKLGNVSELTLPKIAEKIKEFLDQTTKSSNSYGTQVVREDTKQPDPKSPSETEKPKASEKDESKVETDIIKYLKGDEFKISTLDEFNEISGISKDLKTSIELALEFWNLDGVRKETYAQYKEKFKKDKYLKNNKTLNDFINKSSKNTKYPNSVAGKGTKSLSKFIIEAEAK